VRAHLRGANFVKQGGDGLGAAKNVSAAHGVTVHSRAVEIRDKFSGQYILRQGSAARLGQANSFRRHF